MTAVLLLVSYNVQRAAVRKLPLTKPKIHYNILAPPGNRLSAYYNLELKSSYGYRKPTTRQRNTWSRYTSTVTDEHGDKC